jgi:outer membrane protein assembly factor BamB
MTAKRCRSFRLIFNISIQADVAPATPAQGNISIESKRGHSQRVAIAARAGLTAWLVFCFLSDVSKTRTAGVFLAVLWAGCATAGDWPQFRGPEASGVDRSAPAPISWNIEKGENLRWRTAIPGLAHSSPIIWGNVIYVTTAVGPGNQDVKVGLYGDIASADDQDSHQWRLLAVEKESGKIVWDMLGYQGIPRGKRHPKSTHCNSTPATDGQRIVAIFGSEGLFCFDRHGKLLWTKDLGPMKSGYYVVPDAEWGFSSSPVIHDGKVVVLCDVLGDSFIAEFDLADGHELWRTARQDVPTWGTPAVAKAGDRTEILVNGWHQTGAYDFADGKEIWKLDGGGDIPVPTPIVADGLAYFTSAHGAQRPMRAIRLEAHGDLTAKGAGATNAGVAWQQERKGNYMQTPIVVGDFLYGCVDNGIVTSFDAKAGAVRYSERLGNGSEGFTASPVSDGRNLYFTSEVGHVYVIPANGRFSVAATNSLTETCLSTAAVSDGTLFYRTRHELLALGATQAK